MFKGCLKTLELFLGTLELPGEFRTKDPQKEKTLFLAVCDKRAFDFGFSKSIKEVRISCSCLIQYLIFADIDILSFASLYTPRHRNPLYFVYE